MKREWLTKNYSSTEELHGHYMELKKEISDDFFRHMTKGDLSGSEYAMFSATLASLNTEYEILSTEQVNKESRRAILAGFVLVLVLGGFVTYLVTQCG